VLYGVDRVSGDAYPSIEGMPKGCDFLCIPHVKVGRPITYGRIYESVIFAEVWLFFPLRACSFVGPLLTELSGACSHVANIAPRILHTTCSACSSPVHVFCAAHCEGRQRCSQLVLQ